jgi:hypothetical protein
MAMLDWIAIGNNGASKLPGMTLLLKYLAELSSTFLNVLKIAIFCEVLECTVQIIGTTNIRDRLLLPNLDTDFSKMKVNNIVIVALSVPCTNADLSTSA